MKDYHIANQGIVDVGLPAPLLFSAGNVPIAANVPPVVIERELLFDRTFPTDPPKRVAAVPV